MSYILQVFEPPPGPKPFGPGEVAEMVDALYEQSPAPGDPTYRNFLRLVKASASPIQRGEWMDALAADDPGPVFNIAVESGRADVLVPFVVRCARTLRLAVLDQQAAIAYWPDATEIRFPARKPAPGVPDAVKASEMDPVELPAGQPYLLYCGFFMRDERSMAEELPKMLAGNTRPPHAKPYEWVLALEKRLARAFGRHATADSIWAQDLPVGERLFNIMPLAVKSERIREARPRILQLVDSVDMWLFDPHAMQVHGPDGQICWRGANWRAPGNERGRPDGDLGAEEVPKLVAPLLATYGFERNRKGEFVRRFPRVKQTVVIYGSHWEVKVNVWLEVTRRTDLPQQVVPSGLPEAKDTVGIWGLLGDLLAEDDFDEPLFYDRHANGVHVRRHAKLEPVAHEIGRVLVERALPYYDARTSLDAIHAAVNGPRAEEHPLWPVLPSARLTIAYMADEPRVAEMAAQELEKLRTWKFDPRRGLNRTEWQRELPKVEGFVEWLASRG